MPLDVDAVTSPRYTREPLSLSLHLIEVSHISIRKSSITLRCFNMSSCLLRNTVQIYTNIFKLRAKSGKKLRETEQKAILAETEVRSKREKGAFGLGKRYGQTGKKVRCSSLPLPALTN